MSEEMKTKDSAETASQVFYRKMNTQRAYHLMADMNEIQQAERIARHYLSHAEIAQHILKITETTKYHGNGLSIESKEVIKHLADQIRNNHAHTLGIELHWERPES